MHRLEQQLIEEIRKTFAANGATASDMSVKAAAKLALMIADDRFFAMLYLSRLKSERTVASAFQGIRVLVRYSKPIPGVVQFLTDSAPLDPIQLDHDVGWGLHGQSFGELEQIEILRTVYSSIADSLPSRHDRLELLSALQEDAPRPVSDIWELLVDFPDAASIESACRMILP